MINVAKVEQATADLLDALDLGTEDKEHVKATPMRVAKAWMEFLGAGYMQNPEDVLSVCFDSECEQMIIVKDIPVFSLCIHHMLPFIGTAKIGYIPSEGKIVGLSKLARLVDIFAHRLQVQERLTQQIADALNESSLDPLGVGVVIEAEHMCMTARGVKKPGSKTVTSVLHGELLTDGKVRAEFMSL